MILDTNVISEVMRGDPLSVISVLLEEHGDHALALAAVTVQEISYGLARLPDGNRRDTLSDLWNEIREGLVRYVHPLDVDTALLAGHLLASREAKGRFIGVPDAQIAATCLIHNDSLATRNTRDFDGLGIELVNPWAA